MGCSGRIFSLLAAMRPLTLEDCAATNTTAEFKLLFSNFQIGVREASAS